MKHFADIKNTYFEKLDKAVETKSIEQIKEVQGYSFICTNISVWQQLAPKERTRVKASLLAF